MLQWTLSAAGPGAAGARVAVGVGAPGRHPSRLARRDAYCYLYGYIAEQS